MALLQALFTLLSRSIGKIFNAIFGWAVVALFGRTTPKQHALLTALVGMAVLWPVLVIGIVVPRAATFLVALVPVADTFPKWILRVLWLGLALIIQIGRAHV